MDVEQAISVARLIRVLGEVSGRKRLQKIVHLLKSKGFGDFSQEFDLHYFGPFSRQLADQLDFLCAAGVVDERRVGDTYKYAPHIDSARSQHVIDALVSDARRPPWTHFAEQLNNKDTGFLEALSTLVYLKKSHHAHRIQPRTAAERIKPHLKRLFPEVEQFAKQHTFS